MTNQEKKAYLQQYQRLNAKINRLTREEAEWRRKATSITSASDGMPHGSGVSDKVGCTAAKIADLQTEINREIDELVDLRQEIESVIQTVPDDVLRDLLVYRYIDGCKFEQIALEMNYNYRWITRLHGRALSKLALESPIKRVL